MMRLAVRVLAAHPARHLGSLVALWMVAVVAAGSGILLESALRTDPQSGAFAGATVVVSGQQVRPTDDSGNYEGLDLPGRVPVPSEARERLRALAHLDVVEFKSVPAVLTDGKAASALDVVTRSRSMATVGSLTPASGRLPQAPDEVAIPSTWATRTGVGVGDSVSLRTVTRRLPLHVVGVAHVAAQPDVVSPVILSDTTNARLAGSSPVDFVAVTAKEPSSNMSAVARVRAALRGSTATVIPPERAALSMSGDTVAARRNLIDLSGTFAGLALLVGLFVAVTTLALSAAQSARDIALLRAIGATPRQARRLLAAQSILLAGVSGVLGCLVGPWLAGTALASLIAHGVTPRFVMVQFSWIPLVSTIGGVGLVAWLATVLAARKATRIRPVEALRDSTAEPVGGIGRWRVVLGAFVLVGSLIVSGIHMPGGGGTNQAATASLVVLVLMAAIGILGPLLAKVGSILMWPVLRVGGRMGLLASANSRMYSRRTASATTATALVVSLAALTVFLPAMVESATDRAVAERERGTVRVTSDLGFAPADVRRARHAEGVEAIVGLAHSVVIHGRVSTIDFKATCVLGDRIDDVLQLGVIRGSIPSSWTRGVVISRQVAESWNVTPGDKVELLMADGRITEPEVLATFSNALGFADVLMPWSMSTEQHAGIDEVVVRADTRAGTPERLRAALRDPRSIVTSNTGSAAADEDTALNLWLTRRLLGLVCLMAGVALVATLAMVTVSRRGELTALRLLGATHRQLRSMLRAEGLTVWCVGVGQGVLVACVALLPLLHALPGARLATAPVLEMLAVLLALAIACFGTVALSLRVVTRGGAHR